MRPVDKVRYEVASRVMDLYPSFPIPRFRISEESEMFVVTTGKHHEYVFKMDLHFSEAEARKSCFRAADRMMKFWALNPSKAWEEFDASELSEWVENYRSQNRIAAVKKPGRSFRDGIVVNDWLEAKLENE